MKAPGIPATMWTFQAMIDSETTRLLARHYGLALTERDHLLVCALILARLFGGTGKVPLLRSRGAALTGPLAIAQHFDAALPAANRLIPDAPSLAAQVSADWEAYNDDLGTAVAVYAYFHLLFERALMQPIFATPVPWIEAALLPLTYPVLRAVITSGLKLSAEAAAAAAKTILASFDATDARIADGRRFLAGDRLTLGDIALCGAAAPLLLPRGYGALMPPLEAMPLALRTLMEGLRARPTAAFVQRLYDTAFDGS
ncbi:glutathione S-transferase C-terminal domain-containing protein [Sphingomonas sp.]|uniref:glutathione S-transferase C-terminal domain-containing protein n=1 Tax=Sphingomonas sp. TaxID=28214 RepID=UPI0028AF84B7|nr:glutathione S-transferase C-terminal domain-containing protein [Sphingomonas sp.]